jgi:hypothetical protein
MIWLILGIVVVGGFAILLFRARHGWGNRTESWQDAQPGAYASVWLSRLRRAGRSS